MPVSTFLQGTIAKFVLDTMDGGSTRGQLVVRSTPQDQLLHDQLSADQLFTRSTSLSQLL